MEKNQRHTNSLSTESSPYLLQHAHNPVNWMAWGETASQKAKDENKLMLVSVGYAACHWCHVMEHECFENEAVAIIMNRHFICIKVDREERPDVDHVYMEAVQLMTKQGGWPLNCFTTPDGKPVYGGTYFPREQWTNILEQLANIWETKPEALTDYGEKLVAGMQVSGIIPSGSQESFDYSALDQSVKEWKSMFDNRLGGPDKAPKFPLPVNYNFLLHYGKIRNDLNVLNHVELTLDKMARGGIYDQVGGGFARYATDVEWKIPHFEKMLYDNAQLLPLYAEAYKAYGKVEYLEIAAGIKSWLKREMRHESGGYYSAIDADSEGIEGLFYTWPTEFEDQINRDGFERFYHTDENGLWEDRIIPVRKTGFREMAEDQEKSETEIIHDWNEVNQGLLKERNKRIRPQTDDKCLCGWNAMLASGFAAAYHNTEDVGDLREAQSIVAFLEREMTNHETGGLYRTWKNGTAKINGFLEDYAWLIDAYIKLYQADYAVSWLEKAKAMTLFTLDHFYDAEKGLFFFTASGQTDLVSRPVELSDNVIPSSNALMAHNLDTLAGYFDLSHFREKASRLLGAVQEALTSYGAGYGLWADLHLKRALGNLDITITGPDSGTIEQQIRSQYYPLSTFAVSSGNNNLPIFHNRFSKDRMAVYICRNFTCQEPLYDVSQVIQELQKIYDPA